MNEWDLFIAAVARHVYLNKGTGVGGLKKKYSGAVNRGFRPHHHKDGSGSIARAVLHSLEKIKVVELDPNGGRRISQDGQKDLDRIAAQLKSADEE